MHRRIACSAEAMEHPRDTQFDRDVPWIATAGRRQKIKQIVLDGENAALGEDAQSRQSASNRGLSSKESRPRQRWRPLIRLATPLAFFG